MVAQVKLRVDESFRKPAVRTPEIILCTGSRNTLSCRHCRHDGVLCRLVSDKGWWLILACRRSSQLTTQGVTLLSIEAIRSGELGCRESRTSNHLVKVESGSERRKTQGRCLIVLGGSGVESFPQGWDLVDGRFKWKAI